MSGYRCGAVALKGRRLCYWHFTAYKNRVKLRCHKFGEGRLKLPLLEDARSIQFGLSQVVELLSHGRIDAKSAGVMVYALQAASINLRSPDLAERREYEGEDRSLAQTLLKYLKLPVPNFDEPIGESEGRRKFDENDLSFDEEDEEEIRMLRPIEQSQLEG